MIQAQRNKQKAKGVGLMPDYTAQNREAAAIILADPRRYLGWPEERTDEEVEATGPVRWARLIEARASEE